MGGKDGKGEARRWGGGSAQERRAARGSKARGKVCFIRHGNVVD